MVKSDGTVWFTDPNYGLGQTQPGRYVYRFSPENGNGTVTAVATSLTQPNGLCFSPDEQRLCVADSDTSRHQIRVFDVSSGGLLTNERLFCNITSGVPDGIRCDADGRIYSSAANGVWIFLPDGRLAGKILVPNTVANLCFGDDDYQTLYIVAQPGLYSLRLRVAGTPALKKLAYCCAPNCLTLSWSAPSTGFRLESAYALDAQLCWSRVDQSPTVTGWLNVISFPITGAAGFYRLRK